MSSKRINVRQGQKTKDSDIRTVERKKKKKKKKKKEKLPSSR